MNDVAREILSKDVCDTIELYESRSAGITATSILYIHIIPKELTGTIDKYYVGITKRTFKRRCGLTGNCYKSAHFRNAINKYGWNNIKHIIISDKLTYAQTKELEVKLIAYLKCNDRKYGYNIAKGGDFGGNVKPTLKVYRYKLTGEYVDSFNSVADAGRFFECDRGIINCTIDKNRTAKGFQWRSYKVDNCGEYKKAASKTVYQYDSSWNFIQEFKTVMEASKSLGIPKTSIYKSASKAKKIAYGFYFSYNKLS